MKNSFLPTVLIPILITIMSLNTGLLCAQAGDLSSAVESANVDLVKQIVTGAEKPTNEEVSKALTIAVRKLVFKDLVSEGGTIQAKWSGESLAGPGFDDDPFGDMFGTTTLKGVSEKERKDLLTIISLLLDSGADPNMYKISGYTSASEAPVFGSRNVKKLQSGTKGTIVKSPEGTLSALGLAEREGDSELADLLKKHGAE